MATTFWVSSSAKGTGDGSSFANAALWYDTSGSDYALHFIQNTAVKGDIVNIIADGTYTANDATVPVITNTNLNGTDYDSDPGLIIRGVADAAETPAVVTFEAPATGSRWMSFNSAGANYITIEGIHWDMTTVGAGSGSIVLRLSNAACGPFRVRYFTVTGYDDDAANQGDAIRRMFDAGTSPSNFGEVAYGLIRNCPSFFEDNTGQNISLHHCVIWSKGVWSDTFPNWISYTNTAGSSNTNEFRYNTVYADVSDDISQVTEASPASGDYGTVQFHSNVFWINSDSVSVTVLTDVFGGSSGSTATYAGNVGYNILYTGPDLAAGEIGAYYEDPWSGSNDQTATETAAATLFNAPAVAYTWDANSSGYELSVPGDLRLLLHKTAGLSATVPGALPLVADEDDGDDGDGDVDDGDDPAAVPFLDVLPFYSPVLRLDLNSYLKTDKNRVRGHYLRGDKEDKVWREFAARRYSIAPSTAKTVTSGIETATYVLVESDNAVQVNASATPGQYLPAAKMVLIAGGSYDYVQLNNASSTDTAEPLTVVVD